MSPNPEHPGPKQTLAAGERMQLTRLDKNSLCLGPSYNTVLFLQQAVECQTAADGRRGEKKKPVSLTYRCPCRFYESNVARANIKHLKILSTPNCSLQIVARLKSNSKQVCIDPKLKWIQEYLEKALNKPRHRTHKKKQQKKRGPLCPSRATPLKSPGRKNGGSRCKRQAL
ncbi:stromal cell-derived factor 1 isoform X2 [Malurus melanocephalus]|uniref:stromal cell-derived factor 1 isoform X2 n=1 Tax=Malurus melanocephalus TaxID=175006 RepID=UPI0025482C6F|nr:stromal cell-derived factor 1 isoform X2 [Malurus melanocephalus]